MHQKLVEQSKRFDSAHQQLQILRSEVAEVRAGLLNMSKRIVSCERAADELSQSISAQQYDDPEAKIYSRAVKMIGLGADIEEVMRECELPRAEAELLMTLHVKPRFSGDR
ncbi:ATPase involved in DNA repair [Pseudoalteromonas luteoviolacea B = ATCC 29581]|nr:ATPase involved in DNA repair [Pseudoalteromonas luteoviolacea B = ATCC 29581]